PRAWCRDRCLRLRIHRARPVRALRRSWRRRWRDARAPGGDRGGARRCGRRSAHPIRHARRRGTLAPRGARPAPFRDTDRRGGQAQSSLYVTHRSAVNAIPIAERAVPLIPADDAAAAVARARRDMADGADAIIVKPGAPGLDLVPRLAALADRPLGWHFTPAVRAPVA